MLISLVKMGINLSSSEKRKDYKIQRELQEIAQAESRVIKMLLLGSGDSGKSTIVKQMKILRSDGFSESDYQMQRTIIYCNVVEAMCSLIHAMNTFSIQYANADSKELTKIVLGSLDGQLESLSETLTSALKALWADDGIKKCFERRSEFQVNDSAQYFLDGLDRIGRAKYLPTQDDLLRSQVHTVGIVDIPFEMNGYKFRSERRKWIHCFDSVNSIVYVVSMSEYDQCLAEDNATNRMHESLRLFRIIITSRYFHDVSTILFLNKKDLFEEKIQTRPLTIAFPEYPGGRTYHEGSRYIKERFLQMSTNAEKTLYVHITCAVDTNQISFVLDATIDVIVQKYGSENGLY